MSITATPHARRSVLKAVIEEARNRARRRRTRYTLVAMVVLAAAMGAYFSTHRGGDGGVASAARALQRIDIVPSATPRANGALTIMDVQANAKHEGPAGWYSISTVDKLGRLHKLARCSVHVRSCGEVESIDWSPDGRSLAFAVTSISMKNPFNGVHVLNLRTGRELQILKAGQYGENDWESLDWSPDGKRLAYTANGGIAVINADGSARKLLRPPKDRFDRSPSWSPDGAWIAFASSGPQEYPGIWAMRADGSQRRQLVRSGRHLPGLPTGRESRFTHRSLRSSSCRRMESCCRRDRPFARALL